MTFEELVRRVHAVIPGARIEQPRTRRRTIQGRRIMAEIQVDNMLHGFRMEWVGVDGRVVRPYVGRVEILDLDAVLASMKLEVEKTIEKLQAVLGREQAVPS